MLRTLIDLAYAGAIEAMKHYEQAAAIEVTQKADNSPVTAADLAVDEIIFEGLSQTFGDIPIVTEERAATHDASIADGRFFLVDPIDGTKEFINRNGEFTVNIALIENRKPVMGVIAAPAIDQIYYGAAGEGAFRKSCAMFSKAESIKVRPLPQDKLAVLASRSHRTPATDEFIQTFPSTEILPTGSSLKFCMIAAGKADIYPCFGPTMEWDTAAGQAILEAAGGSVKTPEGTPFRYGKADFRNGFFVARSE